MGNFYFVITTFCFVAMGNGVNLTDGLDGLAGGAAAFALVAMSIVALPICSGEHTIYEWIFLIFYIPNIYVYDLFFNTCNFLMSVFGPRYSFDRPTNRNQKYVICHLILPFLLLMNANIIQKVA